MAEAFGGIYQCVKNKKHRTGLWFFDSKPEERPCPYCGALARLVHVKDYATKGKAGAKARMSKRVKA